MRQLITVIVRVREIDEVLSTGWGEKLYAGLADIQARTRSRGNILSAVRVCIPDTAHIFHQEIIYGILAYAFRTKPFIRLSVLNVTNGELNSVPFEIANFEFPECWRSVWGEALQVETYLYDELEGSLSAQDKEFLRDLFAAKSGEQALAGADFVAFGGTLDGLHGGHLMALSASLETALSNTGDALLAIGVTTDEALAAKPGGRLMLPFTERVSVAHRALQCMLICSGHDRVVKCPESIGKYLEEVMKDSGVVAQSFWRKNGRVLGVAFNSLVGTSGFAGQVASLKTLVVTRETWRGGEFVNRVRAENGLCAVKLVEAPLILVDDGIAYALKTREQAVYDISLLTKLSSRDERRVYEEWLMELDSRMTTSTSCATSYLSDEKSKFATKSELLDFLLGKIPATQNEKKIFLRSYLLPWAVALYVDQFSTTFAFSPAKPSDSSHVVNNTAAPRILSVQPDHMAAEPTAESGPVTTSASHISSAQFPSPIQWRENVNTETENPLEDLITTFMPGVPSDFARKCREHIFKAH